MTSDLLTVQADDAAWQALLHPDDRQGMLDYGRQVIAERLPFDRQYRIVRPRHRQRRQQPLLALHAVRDRDQVHQRAVATASPPHPPGLG